MDHQPDDEYLTIQQAAKYLSIPEPLLRLTIRCGKIPARRRRGRRQSLVRTCDLQPFPDLLSEGSCRGVNGGHIAYDVPAPDATDQAGARSGVAHPRGDRRGSRGPLPTKPIRHERTAGRKEDVA